MNKLSETLRRENEDSGVRSINLAGTKFPTGSVLRGLTLTKPLDLQKCGGSLQLAKITFEAPVLLQNNHLTDLLVRDCDFLGGLSIGGATINQFKLQGGMVRGHADFVKTTFSHDCLFDGLIFWAHAGFEGARFGVIAHKTKFDTVTFAAGASFCGATIGHATFEHCRFQAGDPKADECQADFSRADFGNEPEVEFYRINAEDGGFAPRLRRAKGVGGVRFLDVNWCTAREGRLTVQDEEDLVSQAEEGPSYPHPRYEVTPEDVADVYRQLASGFGARSDVVRMHDCQAAVDEVTRQGIASRLGWRYLLSPEGATLALYRWVSNYGQSYARAFRGLMILLVAFGALYAFCDMEPTEGLVWPTAPQLTLLCECPASPTVDTCLGGIGQGARRFFAGLRQSLEVGTLASRPAFVPSENARWLQLLERIVVPAQVALFVLALRRRFRRSVSS